MSDVRNSYNGLIKSVIQSNDQDKLYRNEGNLKNTWKIINEVINKPSRASKISELKTANCVVRCFIVLYYHVSCRAEMHFILLY